MKRNIFIIFTFFFCLSAIADKAKTQVVIWAKDGTKVAYALEDNPKITFTISELVIKANNVEVNYDLDKMLRFTYENEDFSNITDLKSDEAFTFKNDALIFPTLPANSTIYIYSVNGTVIFNKKVQSTGKYAITLSNLNMGVYLVKVNGITHKILKR